MNKLRYDIKSFQNLSILGIGCGVGPADDLPRKLEMLAEIGYQYVYFGYAMFDQAQEFGGVTALRRAVADAGLKVQSAHFGYLTPGPGDTPQRLKDIHLRDLDTAGELGLRAVTTHYLSITNLGEPGFLNAATLSAFQHDSIQGGPSAFNEAIGKLGGPEVFLQKNNEHYRWLCDEAKARNLTVTIETAISHLSRTPEQIIGLMREIDRSNLGICLDSGHSHIMGVDLADAVRACGPHLVETHFHDNFAGRDLHRPIGIGTIDWPNAIQALREIQFPGPVTFESMAAPHNTYKAEARMYARNWQEMLESTAYWEAKEQSFAETKE